MPSWNQLLNKFDSLPNEKVFVKTLRSESLKRLREIGRLRGNRHVIFYSSAFLQKPQAPADRLQIQEQAYQQILSKFAVHQVETVDYTTTHAVMESIRCASRFTTTGKILHYRKNPGNTAA